MNKYQIRFHATDDHFDSQTSNSVLLSRAGISYQDRTCICASSSSKGRYHEWRIKCTEEQLSVLVLSGAIIIRNLTEQYKTEGLAKLTDDEKEALGLA